MNLSEGITVQAPSGDVYRLHWDPMRGTMVIALVRAGNQRERSMSITVRPLSGNSVEIKPLRRDD